MLDGLVQRHEAGIAHVDRQAAARGGAGPCRSQELLGGGDQFVGAAAHLLRFQHQEAGAGGQHIGHLLHLLDQHRAEGLHALGGDAGGDALEDLAGPGQLLGHGTGPLAHLGGQQDLPAGWGVQAVGHGVQGALIGHREVAHLVDLVAEEVHPHGVRLGGREHVQDAAAHGELAALLHHVHAYVGGVDQRTHQIVQGELLPHLRPHRHQVAQALRDGLQQGAHRHQQHVHGLLGLRVRDAAQGRQASGHGVGPRGELLVRESLPGGQLGQMLGAHQGTHRRPDVLR